MTIGFILGLEENKPFTRHFVFVTRYWLLIVLYFSIVTRYVFTRCCILSSQNMLYPLKSIFPSKKFAKCLQWVN